MKKYLILIAFMLASYAGFGQTQTFPPMKSGAAASMPSSCVPSTEFYWTTDTHALYMCNAGGNGYDLTVGNSVIGSGVANQIAYWTGSQVASGNTNFTFNPSTGLLRFNPTPAWILANDYYDAVTEFSAPNLTSNFALAAYADNGPTGFGGALQVVSRGGGLASSGAVQYGIGIDAFGAVPNATTYWGLVGNYSSAVNQGAGTYQVVAGHFAYPNGNTGGGTVNVNAGFYSQAQAGGTLNAEFYGENAGGNYAFYSPGGKNYLAGSTSVPNINGVVVVDGVQYATIAAAYAALPSTGGVVQLGTDLTITSAQTVTLTTGKPMTLDFAGHTITCALTVNSTVCLTLLKPDSNPRYDLIVDGHGGTLTYSGVATGITGLQIGQDSTHGVAPFTIHNLHIQGFGCTACVGMNWNDVEDASMTGLQFTENMTGWTAGINTNNNYVAYNSFHNNVNAFALTDIQNLTFDTNLVQQNTGTTPAMFTASSLMPSNIAIRNNWFENNGDTTANGRALLFSATANFEKVQIANNRFTAGANVSASSYYVGVSGAGNIVGLEVKGNKWVAGASVNTGFAFGNLTSCFAELWTVCDAMIGTQSSPMSGGINMSAATPRGAFEVGTNGSSPDALASTVAHGFTITDNGGAAGVMGFADSTTPRLYLQARTLAAGSAYSLTLNELGGNVGVDTASPNALLDVGGLTATAGSPTLRSFNSSTVGGTTGNESNLASFGGFVSGGNRVMAGVHLVREATGTDWTTTGLRYSVDVDATSELAWFELSHSGAMIHPNIAAPATPTTGNTALYIDSTTKKFCEKDDTGTVTCGLGGGGSGTVTSFSAGNLSPLFTTSVANSTTTPALSFSLSNAAAGTVFGNATGVSASPAYGTTLGLTEAVAPTGIAGLDLLYPDSTAHRWKMINNNGTATQVVASGADINTSDQVTATHLSAALPVNQGGTGTTSTLTGFVRGNASAMTATELSGDVTTSGSGTTTLAHTYPVALGTVTALTCTNGGGTTTFVGVNSSSTTETTGTFVKFIPTEAYTISKMFVSAATTVPTSETLAVTVMDATNASSAGAAQTVTCSISAAASTCNDTAHSFTTTAGHAVYVKAVCSGGTTSMTGPVNVSLGLK